MATAGLLARNPKTALHIAQQVFVPVFCPAAITLLMDLRSTAILNQPVFRKVNYTSYRSIFREIIKFFELPIDKITLHGARGGAAFLAHQKGQKEDQLALIGRWRSASSVAHYLENAKAHLASLKLGNESYTKLRQDETAFFSFLANRRKAVEAFYSTQTEGTVQADSIQSSQCTPASTDTALRQSQTLNPQPPHNSPPLDLTYDSDSPDPDNTAAPFSLPASSQIDEQSNPVSNI